MNLQQALQDKSNRLDKARRKLAAATLREDAPMMRQFEREIKKLEAEVASNKELKARQTGSKAQTIKAMAFNRALTKKEQADMGKLKKAVKGIVVVHPLTAIGRELGVEVVTGFAPSTF